MIVIIAKSSNAQNFCLFNFNPVTSLCCNGCVVSRVGMRQAACCGSVSYDAVFNLCCNGVVRPRANYVLPACCGTSSYDASGLAKCCNNNYLAASCTYYNNNYWWWWGK